MVVMTTVKTGDPSMTLKCMLWQNFQAPQFHSLKPRELQHKDLEYPLELQIEQVLYERFMAAIMTMLETAKNISSESYCTAFWVQNVDQPV